MIQTKNFSYLQSTEPIICHKYGLLVCFTCARAGNFRQVLFLVIKVDHVTEIYTAGSLDSTNKKNIM